MDIGQEVKDPVKVAEIKEAIRDTRYLYGVTEVTIGEHPVYGSVALIQTEQEALLVRVLRSEWPPD